ncbi:DMT family transporter [bacterium]|nr:DMT family transporter [bacterium]
MSLSKGWGIALVAVTACMFGIGPIFVRYLSQYLDVQTQNAFRYLSGSLSICIIASIFFRKELKQCLKIWPKLLAASFFIVIMQTFWTLSLYRILPATATLIGKISIVFTVVISFAFFPEERESIKSAKYILGTLLCLSGIIGVTLLKEGVTSLQMKWGIIFIILANLFWTFYNVYVQKTLRNYNTVAFTPYVFAISACAFFLIALIKENPLAIIYLPPKVLLILFISGLFCIGLAHSIYYFAIRVTGIALASSILLMSPLLTAIFSYFIFGEILTVGQLISGAVLLIGGYIVSKSKGIKYHCRS